VFDVCAWQHALSDGAPYSMSTVIGLLESAVSTDFEQRKVCVLTVGGFAEDLAITSRPCEFRTN
jgi:hypothetical protein